MKLFLAAAEPSAHAADAGGHAADPTSHAVPHALHTDPIAEIPFGLFGQNVPFLGIRDGHYELFITNHLMMSGLVGLVVILTFWLVSRRVRITSGTGLDQYQTRGRVSQVFETMCVFIRDEVARPNLGHLTDKYIYYIWTVFFFILFANVLGIVPFGAMLQIPTGDSHFAHWGGTATGNLALTGILALLSLIAVIYIGIKETSAREFFSHFNPIGWDDSKMLPIALMLYVLEWLSLFIKCFVLAMRLFGTMMAGHLVLATFVGLIFAAKELGEGAAWITAVPVVAVSAALMLLEIFICFLQAFIFTFLTVLFIAATAHGHEDETGHGLEAVSDEGQTEPEKTLEPARLGPAV